MLKAVDQNPPFDKMLTVKQRFAVDELICDRFKRILGYTVSDVNYRVCCSAVYGCVRYIDLQATFENVTREYHVKVINENAAPVFANNFQAVNIPNHTDHDEMHVTLPFWALPPKDWISAMF